MAQKQSIADTGYTSVKGRVAGILLDSVEGEFTEDGSTVLFHEEIWRSGKGYLFLRRITSGPDDGEVFISGLGFLYSPESAAASWFSETGRFLFPDDLFVAGVV